MIVKLWGQSGLVTYHSKSSKLCCRVFCHIFSQVFGPTLPSIWSHPDIYSTTLRQLFWSFCPTLAVFCPILSGYVFCPTLSGILRDVLNAGHSVPSLQGILFPAARYFTPLCQVFCPILPGIWTPFCLVQWPTLLLIPISIPYYLASYSISLCKDILSHSATQSILSYSAMQYILPPFAIQVTSPNSAIQVILSHSLIQGFTSYSARQDILSRSVKQCVLS
jgi:hypothetical protein